MPRTEEDRQRALKSQLAFARSLRARPLKSCVMIFAASLVYDSVIRLLHGASNVLTSFAIAACLCLMPLVIRFQLGYVMAVVLGMGVGAAVGCLWVLGSAAMMDQPPWWLGVTPFPLIGSVCAASAAHSSRLLQKADEAAAP